MAEEIESAEETSRTRTLSDLYAVFGLPHDQQQLVGFEQAYVLGLLEAFQDLRARYKVPQNERVDPPISHLGV